MKFPARYETRRFITAFTSAPPLFAVLSRINLAKATSSCSLKINFNIIFPMYAYVFQVFYFPHVFPPKICIHQDHLLCFVNSNNVWLEVQLNNSSICNLLWSPVNTSLLRTKYPPSPPYSHTPSVYVLPAVKETKFGIHTRQQAKL